MALNRELASFAAVLDARELPEAVVDKAKACLLHGLVVGAAGIATGFGQTAEEALGSLDGGGPATLLVSGRRAPAAEAAFANAALLHARVQEDTHGTAHLGTVLIPAALALAEETGADGSTLLAALAAGYEVGGAFSREFTSLSTPRGFRASAVYGQLAAAAAAGRVLDLDADRLASALSLASAFAGGTTESFAAGSSEWHFENAIASQSGLLAARLAAAGATGADTAFEGAAGFLLAVTGSRDGAERVTAGLGRTWEILNVTFKLYPVCAFNQIPVAAAVRAAEEAGLAAEDIDRVSVEMNAYEAAYPGMGAGGPFGSLGQTLMSTRFCLALALSDRRVTVDGLRRFDDPALLDLVDRIEVAGSPGRMPMTAALRIRTRDGRELEQRLDGDPAEILSWDFRAAAELARSLQPETELSPEAVEALVHAVEALEEQPDVGAILEPFAAAAAGARR